MTTNEDPEFILIGGTRKLTLRDNEILRITFDEAFREEENDGNNGNSWQILCGGISNV